MGQAPAQATSMGMDPKVAGLLAYLFGWISGLIFFLMEKQNKEVRFHAAQSILLSGAFTVLIILLNILSFSGSLGLLALFGLLSLLVWLAFVGVAILMMVKAYNLQHYKLPIIGDMAENMAGKGTA